MEGTNKKVLKAGMNDYITKPIDRKKLFKTLLKWIKVEERVVYIKEEGLFKDETKESLKIKLKSFNVDEALNRVSGNMELYVKILKKFYDDNKELISKIKELIEEKEWENLKFKIHTLKGVSANLGSRFIPKLCEELEKIVQKESEITKFEIFNSFELELFKTLKEIGTIKKNVEISENEILSEEILKRQLYKLVEVLENFDVKAENIFYNIKETLISKKYDKEVEQIESYLKKYDFEEATKISKKIYKALL